MNRLPLIAWDVDDVLNHFTKEWFDEYCSRHPLPVTFAELTSNPPERLMGISREEFLSSMDDFRMRRFAELAPDDEVLEWFKKNGSGFRHVAVTAAPLVATPLSAEWVVRHFGRWFRGFFFVPSPRAGDDFVQHERSKGEVLEMLKEVDYFIDDIEQNLESASHLKLRPVIFPAPWNRRRGQSKVVALAELVG